ncbi:MAG: hypothetical protein JXM70_22990, partial [Pirellulales bacterium]|nr:hypothetical protein [Pirellulales bacterium]
DQRQDDVCSVAYWYQQGPSKQFAPSTTAEQRKYPCIDPVIAWGEDFLGDKTAEALDAPNQPDKTYLRKPIPARATCYHGEGRLKSWGLAQYWDTDHVVSFKPKSKKDAWVELSFEVTKKEPYRLLAVLERSPDGGIYQAFLNGVKVGRPIDLYQPAPRVYTWPVVDDYQLMDFWPEPGKYTLRLECVGRHPLSTGTSIGVNSVRLRERRPRVKEIGYLKDYDWRKKPIMIDHTVDLKRK